MQETKLIYTIHFPTRCKAEIFNKDKFIIKIVSQDEETAEVILEEIKEIK